jgi:hypothetical protein
MAAGGLVGMHVENSDETVSTRYFHKDHLGSIAVITDESGAVLERLSYDAWGKRRYPSAYDDPSGSITSQTSRGFIARRLYHTLRSKGHVWGHCEPTPGNHELLMTETGVRSVGQE